MIRVMCKIGIGIAIGISVLVLLCGGLYVAGKRQIAAREPEQLSQVMNRFSGRIVDVHGRRVHIVEQGVGPTVLLIHGFAASTFDWEESIFPMLAKNYHTIALDLYGMGFSERDDQMRYGFDLWVRQIGETLDALNVKRATLIGHSLGGAVGILFAAEYPERVDRLVLISALSPSGIRETPWWFFVAIIPGIGEFFIGQLEYFSPSGFSTAHYERERCIYRVTGTRRALLRYIRGGVDFPRLSAAYRKVIAPTLILHGTADKEVPYTTIDRVKPLIQNAHMITDVGGGHWLYRDKPEWLVSQIRTFFLSKQEVKKQ